MLGNSISNDFPQGAFLFTQFAKNSATLANDHMKKGRMSHEETPSFRTCDVPVFHTCSGDNPGGAFASADVQEDSILAPEPIGYANVLDMTAVPTPQIYGDYSTNKYNNFCDLGSWHGYYLHPQDNTEAYGGFAGPVILAEEYPVNLSDCIGKWVIEGTDGTVYDLADAEATVNAYPGKLVQGYAMEDIDLKLELILLATAPP